MVMYFFTMPITGKLVAMKLNIKKLSVSNIKALLDFNEKKGSVDSSSLNFIKTLNYLIY